MNLYQIIFLITYVWALFYTVTFLIHNIKERMVLASVSSGLCIVLSCVLCYIYVSL
ncbi:MAG: hypothetical protein IKA17_06665 [Clostridia bacterium]|nr:hypothetical protein [Clostridia bacterium]